MAASGYHRKSMQFRSDSLTTAKSIYRKGGFGSAASRRSVLHFKTEGRIAHPSRSAGDFDPAFVHRKSIQPAPGRNDADFFAAWCNAVVRRLYLNQLPRFIKSGAFLLRGSLYRRTLKSARNKPLATISKPTSQPHGAMPHRNACPFSLLQRRHASGNLHVPGAAGVIVK